MNQNGLIDFLFISNYYLRDPDIKNGIEFKVPFYQKKFKL